jgi:phosphoglycerate kinase
MFRTLDQADVRGKRVLVRVDLNVPVENGKPADLTRIERVTPTIREIADKGGKVILLSHFGRPKGLDPKDSLEQFAPTIAEVLGRPVAFAADCIGDKAQAAIGAMKSGDILCLENTRFHKGKEKNDPAFVAALAALGALTKVLETPTRPLAAIVAGAKVSTKLDLLGNLLSKVDVLVIGGGWPTPSWPRSDMPWASRCASTTSCRPRARS